MIATRRQVKEHINKNKTVTLSNNTHKTPNSKSLKSKPKQTSRTTDNNTPSTSDIVTLPGEP